MRHRAITQDREVKRRAIVSDELWHQLGYFGDKCLDQFFFAAFANVWRSNCSNLPNAIDAFSNDCAYTNDRVVGRLGEFLAHRLQDFVPALANKSIGSRKALSHTITADIGSSHRFGASPALASVSACGLRLRQLRLIVSPYWEARSDSGYESKKGQAEEALIDF